MLTPCAPHPIPKVGMVYLASARSTSSSEPQKSTLNFKSQDWTSKQYNRSPQKSDHRVTVWASNSTSQYIPKRTESRDLNRYFSTPVHSSVILNSQTVSISGLWWTIGRTRHSVSIQWHIVVQPLSRVRLFVTLWTVARQDPWSIGLPKQEYWNSLPCPSPESGILFSLKKEMKFWHGLQPWGHCINWKKPVTKRQILHSFCYFPNSIGM